MILVPTHISLLNILRKNIYQSREEFYRSAEKVYENIERRQTILYMAIRSLEGKGLISLDRVGRGKRSRIVTIRITERGIVESGKINILNDQQKGVEKAREVARKSREKMSHTTEPLQPCGIAIKKCFHAGCYMAYYCKAQIDS